MSVRVAVRCRPFNTREAQQRSVEGDNNCIVAMTANSTFLTCPEPSDIPRRQFTFDHSFWSFDRNDPSYANQEMVFNALGKSVLKDAFEGYHSCVFAYGQTGAGKSYSMMGGDGDERGIVPRLCEELFLRVEQCQKDGYSAKVEVSYMEIYLERVRDLLNPSNHRKLKVREHSSTGPYVEDLTSHAVSNYAMVEQLMNEGNKMRTVAATKMNDVSSRSHAIFQITFTQVQVTTKHKEQIRTERASKISLVDLAGSERSGLINKGSNARLKEGNVINKSLSTLGKVIATLAEKSTGKTKGVHVPYRESVLTWLLRESLGGNSKTVMLAAISPAADNFEETLSTLRYANQAKRIINKAVVNEDATATMVRKLTEEIELLRAQLAAARETQGKGKRSSLDETTVAEKLKETEKLKESLTASWEEKLERTKKFQASRLEELKSHGIVINGHSRPMVVMAPRAIPYLMNANASAVDDDDESQALMYYLEEGLTRVGHADGRPSNFEDDPTSPRSAAKIVATGLREIFLRGPSILPEHCLIKCINNDGSAPIVILMPKSGASITVNDEHINRETKLFAGDMVSFGPNHSFRFHNPLESRSSRMNRQSSQLSMAAPMTPGTPFSLESVTGVSSSSVHQLHGPAPTPLRFRLLNNGYDTVGSLGAGPLDCSITDPPEETFFEARKRAVYPYDAKYEDALLHHLIDNMSMRKATFKLLPAYGLYMMVRHCHVAHGHAALGALLSKIATLMKIAMFNGRNGQQVNEITFWLSNGIEFLMVLRTDETLGHASGEAQQLLTDAVQEAFQGLLRLCKQRLKPAIKALLHEGGAFQTQSWWRRSFSTKKKVKPSKVQHDITFLLSTFDALYSLCCQCLLTPPMIEQLFSSIYFFVAGTLFNQFIGSKDNFRWDRGLQMRFNLSRLSEWSTQHALMVDHHLNYVIQASQLLQANKSSLSHLDFICESCALLNSVQVERILRHYKPSEDEGKVPGTLIDCIKARAMNNADVLAREDESINCRLQLERNPNFALPFRLAGQFHMHDHLHEPELVEMAREYLDQATLRHDNKPDLALSKSREDLFRPTGRSPSVSAMSAKQWARLDD
eukprot:m.197133 g.197133  ORF g.197133 m.197133 type:complete len:1089 (-) comp25865_c0_seq2:49-3315(-)